MTCLTPRACYNPCMLHPISPAPLNWPAIAVAAFAMLLVYSAWFSPILFQRAFIRHTGIRATDWRAGDKRRFTMVKVVTLVLSALVISLIAQHLAATPYYLFASVSLLWLFVMFEQLTGMVWRREPFSLFLLLALRSLVTLETGAFVFYLWSFL